MKRYDPDVMRKFKMGEVVKLTNKYKFGNVPTMDDLGCGHVIGFEWNQHNNLCVTVKFPPIYPSKIDIIMPVYPSYLEIL